MPKIKKVWNNDSIQVYYHLDLELWILTWNYKEKEEILEILTNLKIIEFTRKLIHTIETNNEKNNNRTRYYRNPFNFELDSQITLLQIKDNNSLEIYIAHLEETITTFDQNKESPHVTEIKSSHAFKITKKELIDLEAKIIETNPKLSSYLLLLSQDIQEADKIEEEQRKIYDGQNIIPTGTLATLESEKKLERNQMPNYQEEINEDLAEFHQSKNSPHPANDTPPVNMEKKTQKDKKT